MPDTKIIEVRCQGLFAYLRGNDGARWLAVPPPHYSHPADAHPCRLLVRRSVLVDPDDSRFEDLGGPFVEFKFEMKSLSIDGAQHAPPKPGINDAIPGDGFANGDPGLDNSWTSQRFVPSLDEFYPPETAPLAHVNLATFLMTLPANTEWHGLAPRKKVQKCKWDFTNQETGAKVGVRQVITDVVGFHLWVPVETQLQIDTGSSIENVPVNFTAAGAFPLRLTAGPPGGSDPAPNEPLVHFKHLYHLSDDPNRPDVVLPVLGECVDPGPVPTASDIFCPGAEGEGEGGG